MRILELTQYNAADNSTRSDILVPMDGIAFIERAITMDDEENVKEYSVIYFRGSAPNISVSETLDEIKQMLKEDSEIKLP